MTFGSTAMVTRLAGMAAAVALCAGHAQAQFGGIKIPLPSASSNSSTSDGCPKGKKKSAGSSIFGSVLGQVAGNAASRAGVSSWVPISEVSDQLTNAIACRLDPEEQKQAAQATLEATRSDVAITDAAPDVGSTSTWTSNTREDVSGSSTVVARNDDEATGLQCITVTDVIIVKGEETTANKRMCRVPGSARYSLAA